MDAEKNPAPVRRFHQTASGFRWDDVSVKVYKPEGTHFRDITRQVLFEGTAESPTQMRYFEIAPGGHSTFERHEHPHAVFVLRGQGRVLVGETVAPVTAFDLVHVPPMTWHQFRAASDAPLGFVCLVPCDRDRPMRPTPDEAAALRAHPVLREFIRL